MTKEQKLTTPKCDLHQPLAYHFGTVMTVLSILRCKKYAPQCNGNAMIECIAIYAGSTYAAVKDFHDFGAVNQQAAHYHRFSIGPVKGCVAASINHLGIYALLLPVEAMVGKTASATQQVSWVDELAKQNVISMCNVQDTMNSHYASQGRQPNFPRKADPDFNPDVDF
eukprot:3020048-Amphidinium_carterae.1